MAHGKQVTIYHKEPRCVFFGEKSRKAQKSVEELSLVLSYVFMAENTLDKRKPGLQVHGQAVWERLCCAVTTQSSWHPGQLCFLMIKTTGNPFQPNGHRSPPPCRDKWFATSNHPHHRRTAGNWGLAQYQASILANMPSRSMCFLFFLLVFLNI